MTIDTCIYKLLTGAEWDAFRRAGKFEGSPDDLRDGFVHFSAAHQVRTTFDKYFSHAANPVIAVVEASRLGDALKWEVSRGGDKFPHLYRALILDEVRESFPITKGPNAQPVFPLEIE